MWFAIAPNLCGFAYPQNIILEELIRLISDFKKDRRFFSFDESATKQAVILRILKALGWDLFNIDEVYPEYSVGGKKVNYALRYNGRNKAFIEEKDKWRLRKIPRI